MKKSRMSTRRIGKNKKAQVYPLFVAVFTIVALTFALLHLDNSKRITDLSGDEVLIGTKQTAVFASLQDADAINLFLEQAAELSAQKAVDSISKSCFFNINEEQEVDEWESPCGKYVYPLWSTNETLCFPDCETAFINAFKENLLNRTELYYYWTGIDLPISYNISLEVHDKYFLIHGLADSESEVNVLSTDARTKNPVSVAQTYTGGSFIWPVKHAEHTLTSCFGKRSLKKGSRNHPGIDIRAPTGTPVVAVAKGKVTAINKQWGRVVINHGSGLSTEYLHLDTISVDVNDEVVQGEVIGTVGGRGKDASGVYRSDAYPPHLHFGVLYKGVPASLNYKGQQLVLHSFGLTDYIQPACLLRGDYSVKPGSNCDTPVNTNLEEVCAEYNLPEELFYESEGSKAFKDTKESLATPQETSQGEEGNPEVTGSIPAPPPEYKDSLISSSKGASLSNAFGTYTFRPGFTVMVTKKIKDPIKPVVEWFKEAWYACDDDPKTCLNNKMQEFNNKGYDYKLYFADQCEAYPVFYDMMEFIEDCFSDQKYACICEFNLSKAEVFSREDLAVVFDINKNSASLFVKKPAGYKLRDTYNFYYGRIKPSLASHEKYAYFLEFDKTTGVIRDARLTPLSSLNDQSPATLTTYTFKDYFTLRIAKPEKSNEGVFVVKNNAPRCEYNKNKFRLCASPQPKKEELSELRFALHLRDKPPEPVRAGDVEIIEAEEDAEETVDKVLDAAGFIGVLPPAGFLFSLTSILSVLEDFKPRSLQVIVDVPTDKNGNPLDIVGYEIYCNDYLTSTLPRDVLNTYKPSHFVVLANNELNRRASQLDKYVNNNPYSDFLDLKDCDVPVSMPDGKTVLVPGIRGVMKDGRLVFNLNKCAGLPILIDKVLRKNYCVSLVPVDKNGNKMTEHAISNCVETNSLLDVVVDEMLKKELSAFIPSSLLPEDLKPYVKMPRTSTVINALTGKTSLDLVDIINIDKLDADLRGLLSDFVIDTINKDILGTSLVKSINDLGVWEKQRVLSTLSEQIKEEDARLLFDSIFTGSGVKDSVKHSALEKSIDYIDKSKASEVLRELARSENPETLAYQELLRATNNELSSEEKKQDLVLIANKIGGEEVRHRIIEKAVETGCVKNYGVLLEEAMKCLGSEEIDELYYNTLSDASIPLSVRQELLEAGIARFDDKAQSVLKSVVLKKDFRGAAYIMLEKELESLPIQVKAQFVKDVLKGKLPSTGSLQAEILRSIPVVNNEYVSALLRDTAVNDLIRSKLESYLKSQLDAFFSGECVKVNK